MAEDVETLKKTLEEKEEMIGKLKKKLKEKMAELEEVKAAKPAGDSTAAPAGDVAEQLAKQEVLVGRLKEKLRTVKQEADEAKTELEGANDMNARLKAKLKKVMAELAEVKEKGGATPGDGTASPAGSVGGGETAEQLAKALNDIERYKTKLREVIAENKELKAGGATAGGAAPAAGGDAELQERAAKLQTDLDKFKEAYKKLKEENGKLKEAAASAPAAAPAGETSKVVAAEEGGVTLNNVRILQEELAATKAELTKLKSARQVQAARLEGLSVDVEMINLDKELAEARADLLEVTLSDVRAELESCQLDVELYQSIEAERAKGPDAGEDVAGNAAKFKATQSQNNKLRGALIEVRDVALSDRAAFYARIDKLESGVGVGAVESLKNELQTLRQQSEKAVHDARELREQLDAASQSDSLIEQLTEKNMIKDEEIGELKEAVTDFEGMLALADELERGYIERERMFQEQIDEKENAIGEMQSKAEAHANHVAELETTIAQFRDLVQSLQEQVRSGKGGSADDMPATPATAVSTAMQAQLRRARGQNIEKELLRVKASIAADHVKYMQGFLPQNILEQENDSLQYALLISRLHSKVDILYNALRTNFDAVAGTMDGASAGNDQLTFTTQMQAILLRLNLVLAQFRSSIATCAPQQYHTLAAMYPDTVRHEAVIDGLLARAQADDLPETLSLEELRSVAGQMEHVAATYLPDDVPVWLKLRGAMDLLLSTQEEFTAEARRLAATVRTLVAPDAIAAGTPGERALTCLAEAQKEAAAVISLIKKIHKKVVPQPMTMSNQTWQAINAGQQGSARAVAALRETHKQLEIQSVESVSKTLGMDVLLKVLQAALVKSRPNGVTDTLPEESALGVLTVLADGISTARGHVHKLAEGIASGDHDGGDALKENTATAPWVMRANNVRAELELAGGLKQQLESVKQESLEVMRQLKAAEQHLKDASVKSDVADKRIATLSEQVAQVDTLQSSVRQLTQEVTNYKEAMDALHKDMTNLEKENNKLKDSSKGKKVPFNLPGIAPGGRVNSIGSPEGGATTPTNPLAALLAKPSGESIFSDELGTLRTAVSLLREENARLKGEMGALKLGNLPKLAQTTKVTGPSLQPRRAAAAGSAAPVPAASVDDCRREISVLLRETREFASMPLVVDLTNAQPPAQQFERFQAAKETLQARGAALRAKLGQVVMDKGVGTAVSTSFAQFPTPESSKVMSGETERLMGRVVLPRSHPAFSVSAGNGPREKRVVMSEEEFVKLHETFVQ